jgi:hypothetical protein
LRESMMIALASEIGRWLNFIGGFLMRLLLFFLDNHNSLRWHIIMIRLFE